MKKYLVPSVIISTILLLAYYLINDSLLDGMLHAQFHILVIIFFAQSVPVAWLMQMAQKETSQFPIYIIGAVGFRMITSLMVLTIFYLLKTPDLFPFMVQFSILYLVYLIFELIVVLANLRRN